MESKPSSQVHVILQNTEVLHHTGRNSHLSPIVHSPLNASSQIRYLLSDILYNNSSSFTSNKPQRLSKQLFEFETNRQAGICLDLPSWLLSGYVPVHKWFVF